MDISLSRALFSPRSIAIIGASADPTKTAARPLRYLVDGGYKGAVFPVNPNAANIGEHRAWPSIAAIPETPDLAFILLPTGAAVAAVRECGAKGIPAAIILASGFSDAGEEGAMRQAELLRTARESSVRLVGPSSLGLVNLHDQIVLTGNAAFAEPGTEPGGIFCASQSGSMIGALMSRGNARGIGFAGFISVGGEADLTLGTLCEATLDDPRITSYMLFLETIRDPHAIRRFAVKASSRGKPIVALKLGRSKAAAEIAVTHTGALVGDDDVADSFLADCGIVRVDTLEGLLEAAPLLRRAPPAEGSRKKKPSVGVVTTTGGGAALVVEQLGQRGIAVEAPSIDTHTAIGRTGVETTHGRIVDLTLAGVRYDVMKGALEVMLASRKFDLVIATVGSSARFQPELAVRPIIDVARDHPRLAAFLVPEAPEALAMLTKAGVPCFRTPEACADVIAAALKRRQPRQLATFLPRFSATAETLDEQEGYAILSQLGIPHAETAVTELDAPVVDEGLFPAAVKILDRSIAHKSDVGGVVLGVSSQPELEVAARTIKANLEKAIPGPHASRLLVQRMESRSVGEALLGYRVDRQVGPIVVLAAGGVTTELYKDRCVRVAPVDLDIAIEMIAEVRGLGVLTGFRNQPRGDVEALAHAIVALSQAACRRDLNEIEINPLLVLPEGQGVLAVDVLTRSYRE